MNHLHQPVRSQRAYGLSCCGCLVALLGHAGPKLGQFVAVWGLRRSASSPVRAAGLQLGTTQPACSQQRGLQRGPGRSAWALQRAPQPQSRQSMSSFQARRRSERSQPPVCGPASSAGQGAAGAGVEGDQAPQNTQWRAPDSPSTQPCLRRKLRASLARAPWHPKPSGSPVQACGRPASQLGFFTENLGSISAPKSGTCPPGPLITCINL